MESPAGYSVILVQVPALERAVLPALTSWAPDFLMTDGSSHAHVTLLAPFLADPLPALGQLRALFAGVDPFTVTFRSLGRFPGDGLVYAHPEPVSPWQRLTGMLVDAWPQCPPYGGQFAEVVPHLSIDHADDAAALEPLVRPLLPVSMVVDEAVLAWYEPHHTRVLARFRFSRRSQ